MGAVTLGQDHRASGMAILFHKPYLDWQLSSHLLSSGHVLPTLAPQKLDTPAWHQRAVISMLVAGFLGLSKSNPKSSNRIVFLVLAPVIPNYDSWDPYHLSNCVLLAFHGSQPTKGPWVNLFTWGLYWADSVLWPSMFYQKIFELDNKFSVKIPLFQRHREVEREEMGWVGWREKLRPFIFGSTC